jgi:hypothetical protein
LRKLTLLTAMMLALALTLGGMATAQESNAPADQGVTLDSQSSADAPQTQQVFPLTFKDQDQVYTFSVVTSDKDVRLIVDTLDCCIPGDKWGVRIFTTKEKKDGEVKKVRKVAAACGTGSITDFSGEATAQGSQTYIVEVFYCEGVDIFPAGMEVRFQYEGGTGTATPTGTCQSPDKTCQSEKQKEDDDKEDDDD